MADTHINRDPYMNIKGTTCKSFKIGKTSISFASKAVQADNLGASGDVAGTVSKYKKLVSVTNDKGEKVIYDSEIPLNAVKCVEELNGEYKIVLLNGTKIPISGVTSAVQSVLTDDVSVDKSIAIYNDATGTVITNSGFNILTHDELPTVSDVLEGIDKLNALAEAYSERDDEFAKKVPTMKAVMEYVGTIDSVLDARLNGNLQLS